MVTIRLAICNGKDTDLLRDIAEDVVRDVEHLFLYDLRQEILIRLWDYRRDLPGVVAADEFSSRSLQNVEKSEGLLAILGPSVPEITSQEVTRAFELRQAGHPVDVWVLTNPDQKGPSHQQFLDGIKERFRERVREGAYRTPLEFQAHAMKLIFAYVWKRLEVRPTAPRDGGSV